MLHNCNAQSCFSETDKEKATLQQNEMEPTVFKHSEWSLMIPMMPVSSQLNFSDMLHFFIKATERQK